MLLLIVSVLAAMPAVLLAWNLSLLRRSQTGVGTAQGRVSVLIPARNEGRNIEAAIESVLMADPGELELIVLDDHSSDDTAARVGRIAARDARVRLVAGSDLPDGLCGKPFACAQLAASATGETLVFMDADVRLTPSGLRDLLAALTGSEAVMVSGIPHQITLTLGEKLIVPLMHFVMFAYLPIAFMRRMASPSLGAACGQLLAVRLSAYQHAGGHLAVAGRVHDGIALARRLREAGYLTDLIDLDRAASCRMYSCAGDVLRGFAKNAHEGLGSPRGIVPWTVILLGGQLGPLLALPFVWAVPLDRVLMLGALGIVFAGRAALSWRFRQSWLGTLLHPFGVLVLVGIQWYALVQRLRGRPVAWKGRKISA
jgi:cellulose synthase/poly-beta-1,6-N-acetylglucosamine synthase-like glycosyltransferase